jgi:hypothetical protein
LNLRSTTCCTRRRTGLNSAAAASVAAATATVLPTECRELEFTTEVLAVIEFS